MIIKKYIANLKDVISHTDTRTLTNSLAIISILAMVVSFAINNNPSLGEPIQIILIFFMFFFGGTIGLVFIVRKEAPTLFWNVKGILAIITGLLLLISGWGLAFVLLARYILGKIN